MKEYFEERAKLEAKYQSLLQPLYQKRADVIAGKLDKEPTNDDDAKGNGPGDQQSSHRGDAGIVTERKTIDLLSIVFVPACT